MLLQAGRWSRGTALGSTSNPPLRKPRQASTRVATLPSRVILSTAAGHHGVYHRVCHPQSGGGEKYSLKGQWVICQSCGDTGEKGKLRGRKRTSVRVLRGLEGSGEDNRGGGCRAAFGCRAWTGVPEHQGLQQGPATWTRSRGSEGSPLRKCLLLTRAVKSPRTSAELGRDGGGHTAHPARPEAASPVQPLPQGSRPTPAPGVVLAVEIRTQLSGNPEAGMRGSMVGGSARVAKGCQDSSHHVPPAALLAVPWLAGRAGQS